MDDQRFTNEVNDSGTALVPAKCTNCGGELTVDPTQEAAVCQFCGTPFIVSKAVHNYNVQHNTYQTNIVNQPKKGAVESILDYASERQDKRQQRLDEERRRAEEERIRQQEQKKKRNKTILWILGWIFIFPVPLTILMLRKKEMNPKVKYGIIAAGWIVYLIFMLASNHNNNTESVRDYSNDPVVITTTEVVPKTTKATTKATTAVTETKTEAKTTEEAVEETAIEETTIPETEEPTKAELSVSDIKNAIENGDYSLVTPEFKATMDAYEAFFDDYIAFMNNYTSGEGDFMSMMNDYTEMLNKEMEWADKVDAIDESKLSPADDAYYLLVTLRVEKKLLGSIY